MNDDLVAHELSDIASFRASGHVEAAIAGLDRLLKQLADGGPPLCAATRASLDVELDASRAFVREIGAKDAAAGHPLAAEVELARLAPLLAHPELAEAKEAAASRAREAGRATCARLQTTVTPATPHWSLGVSRYCSHFGVAFESAPPATSVGKVEVDGVVSGMTEAGTQQLRDGVASWISKSLWYEPHGQVTARASTTGRIESSFQHQTVTRHVSYRDKITTYGTSGNVFRPGSNGPTYVSGSATTKLDRVFAYDAEEHRGHYGLTAKISIDVGAGAPLTFTLQHVDNLKAYEHDETFAPAGVSPTHETVPTTDAWLHDQLDRMSTRVVLYLNRRFVALECAAEPAPLEAAARCALAGQTPTPVMATLDGALGEDAQPLIPLLRPPTPPPEKAAPPRPRRARPARASSAEDAEDAVID